MGLKMRADSSTVAPALKALLDTFIDYAGIFPPAALTLPIALDNFRSYEGDRHAWMLRYLVVNASNLDEIPEEMNGRLSVISDRDNNRAATIESKSIFLAERPVYCEVAVDNLPELSNVKDSLCYGKIRTGGLTPAAIPSTEQVAKFILTCAELRLPFKATAGLHHAFRSEQALTYDLNSPRAIMHGFINILMAASFAWNGEKDIEPIVAETDPAAFDFDDNARWRDKMLTAEQVHETRQRFLHSIGSCSFEEPVAELQQFGLMK